jgi:hypothetical protein
MSSSSSHSNIPVYYPFVAVFDAALQDYVQKTGTDLSSHPLATILEACDTPDAVLAVLREQAHAFDQYRNGDWKIQLMRCLKPTVDILLGLSTSSVFSGAIGLVSRTSYLPSNFFAPLSRIFPQQFPPANAIFVGVSILLSVRLPLSPLYCDSQSISGG